MRPVAQKSNTIRNVLIVAAIIVGVGGTLFALGLLWAQRKLAELAEHAADGGVILVSPPEVKEALAGRKKAYVGSWKGDDESSLDIDAEGNLKLVRQTERSRETITMPIAAFRGDDIECRAVITLRIPVTEPPHEVGGRWEMTAKGVKLHR